MNKQFKALYFSGITLDTLGGYLCGLGLLSACAAATLTVRGCWRDGVFSLLLNTPDGKIVKDKKSLSVDEYLLNEWKATIYPGGDTKIPWSDDQKQDTKKKSSSRIARFRSTSSVKDIPFLDAHVVPVHRNVFNPVLGTGGNIGKRNLAKLAVDAGKLLKGESSREWLKNTLYGHPVALPELPSSGTWFPYANKTFNSGQDGFYREGRLSPWSFLLALEGALLLQGGVGRRLSATARSYAAFPFISESPNPIGEADVGLKRAGVFWAPIWDTPATLTEIRALFKRGLVRLGNKAATAPHEFAAAALGLGLDAGATQFAPFELRETTSSQVYEAMPLHVVLVRRDEHSHRAAELISELVPWIHRLPFEPKDAKQKGKFAGLRGPIERTIIAVSEQPGDSASWRDFLLRLSHAQTRIDRDGTRDWRKKCVPLPRLSIAWLDFLWPEGRSGEVEVACALASIGAATGYPLISNIHGIKARKSGYWFPKEYPASTVWHEGEVTTLLGDVLHRRLVDGSRANNKYSVWPLTSSYTVSLDLLGRFLDGALDDEEISRWTLALSLLDWRRPAPRANADFHIVRDGVMALDGLFRPLLTARIPWKGDASPRMSEPDITTALRLVALLQQGDAEAAVDFACTRYRALGAVPIQPADISCDTEQARRVLAGLLIPVSRYATEAGRNSWLLNLTSK